MPVPALQKQAVYTREETRLALLSFPTDRDHADLQETGDFPVSGWLIADSILKEGLEANSPLEQFAILPPIPLHIRRPRCVIIITRFHSKKESLRQRPYLKSEDKPRSARLCLAYACVKQNAKERHAVTQWWWIRYQNHLLFPYISNGKFAVDPCTP